MHRNEEYTVPELGSPAVTIRERKALIQSLDRGLEILKMLVGSELRLAEIAKRLNVNKSTVYRLLSTLEGQGFVAQDRKKRTYKLGLSCLELAGSLLRDLSVRALAEPYLREITEKYNETAFLGILEGHHVVYVEKIQSRSPLAVSSEVGSRARLHCTATAKAIMAFLPTDVVTAALHSTELTRYTPRTITNQNQLLQHLEEVRTRGYALDDEEFCIGLRCVASPFFDYSGQVRGSISISGPSQRIGLERIDELGEAVRVTALRLSRQLGMVEDTDRVSR